METVLIIDTETTGLDPHRDRIVEVAAVRYSVKYACVLDAFSQLCQSDSNEAESINHIPAAAIKAASPAIDAFTRVASMASGCDAILAHNAAFDRMWVPASAVVDVPWICTLNGITWPRTGDARNLVAVALAHGLGVVDPHRALADCMLIARLLTRCAELGTDVKALLALGLRPQATFHALVSFEQKDLAKEKGFQWDAKARRWIREMAIADATPELLGFEVRRIARTVEI